MNFAEALKSATTSLLPHEAEILLLEAHWVATGEILRRSDLYMRGSVDLTPLAGQVFSQWVRQRERGVPLQHITGIQPFLGHRYLVSPAVLIPRPETEVLVSQCVESILRRAGLETVVWEVGLGSGVISLELLTAFPNVHVWASELSASACKIARANAEALLGPAWSERLTILEAERPEDVLGPFFKAKIPRADFLVSNPPYLLSGERSGDESSGESEATPEVHEHEPAMALYAPPSDPLYFYRRIFEGAGEALRADGEIWLEVPHERAALILELATQWSLRGELLKDLTGRDRVFQLKRAK